MYRDVRPTKHKTISFSSFFQKANELKFTETGIIIFSVTKIINDDNDSDKNSTETAGIPDRQN